MYAAAFIGDRIIDLAGWDQGPAGETSNLSVSYSNQFQSVSYIGGSWGRQFFRSGSMATASFDSRFSLVDSESSRYQWRATHFLSVIPHYFANQNSAILKISLPIMPIDSSWIKQVEKLTGIGTATNDGLIRVTVTGKGLEFNPFYFDVPVTNGQTASQWMFIVRVYLSAYPAIRMLYDVSGSGDDVFLTRKSPYAGNDDTLNISIVPTTATGITATPTSTNITNGVALYALSEMTFYDANISVAASQLGTSVLLNTSVTGRLVAP